MGLAAFIVLRGTNEAAGSDHQPHRLLRPTILLPIAASACVEKTVGSTVATSLRFMLGGFLGSAFSIAWAAVFGASLQAAVAGICAATFLSSYVTAAFRTRRFLQCTVAVALLVNWQPTAAATAAAVALPSIGSAGGAVALRIAVDVMLGCACSWFCMLLPLPGWPTSERDAGARLRAIAATSSEAAANIVASMTHEPEPHRAGCESSAAAAFTNLPSAIAAASARGRAPSAWDVAAGGAGWGGGSSAGRERVSVAAVFPKPGPLHTRGDVEDDLSSIVEECQLAAHALADADSEPGLACWRYLPHAALYAILDALGCIARPQQHGRQGLGPSSPAATESSQAQGLGPTVAEATNATPAQLQAARHPLAQRLRLLVKRSRQLARILQNLMTAEAAASGRAHLHLALQTPLLALSAAVARLHTAAVSWGARARIGPAGAPFADRCFPLLGWPGEQRVDRPDVVQAVVAVDAAAAAFGAALANHGAALTKATSSSTSVPRPRSATMAALFLALRSARLVTAAAAEVTGGTAAPCAQSGVPKPQAAAARAGCWTRFRDAVGLRWNAFQAKRAARLTVALALASLMGSLGQLYLFGGSFAFWAPLTAIIITGRGADVLTYAALRQRVAGTLLGAVAGVVVVRLSMGSELACGIMVALWTGALNYAFLDGHKGLWGRIAAFTTSMVAFPSTGSGAAAA